MYCSEGIDTQPYYYGHRRELQQVESLDINDVVKRELLATLRYEHDVELIGAGLVPIARKL
ncbi:MAG: hypothetical protein AAF413_03675 [Patescibacteria group bacterium]